MRRIITIMAATAMALALFASSAVAGGHEWDDHEPHAHIMLIGAEVEGGTLTFRKCVGFSVNENAGTEHGALPTPAHHHSIHTGNAGGSFVVPGALFEAGNWVIPLHPFHDQPEDFNGCDAVFSGMPFPA